jgi:CDP-diacylglycerol---serine O-phosphatidyltransferase
VPRAPWRRRRTTDSPRPAGRRWAGRLRRSGSLARQVLVGRVVGRRHSEASADTPSLLLLPEGGGPARRLPRLRVRRRGSDVLALDASTLAPVSPAVPRHVERSDAPPLSIPLLPGERTRARRLRFALVNACTIASLMMGMTAIFLSFNSENVQWAALCLIGCVIFDGLDGALARKLGVASPFGAQMDSLADMCSFGIAAPVVVYAWLAGSAPAALIVPACALVAVCAAIRLARFNVSPKDGRFFCGVPTTMTAAVLALGTLIAPDLPAAIRILGVAVLALAMVSSFPYVKFARLLRLPPWILAVPVVGALIDYRVTFVLAVLAYLVSGPLIWLRHRPA